jgi:hypothetical protein
MTEKKVLELLTNSKKVLLLEPPYRKTYIPLGLAKIASFIKSNGGKVVYSREPILDDFDVICITSLFTNDIDKVIKSINAVKYNLFLSKAKIIVGGIAASLMDKYILNKTGISPFYGVSKELDKYVPDYTIDWKVSPYWNSFSTVFTQRGCINKCGYCMVHKLEPEIWINPIWKKHIVKEKENVLVSDNNILACFEEHWKNVFCFLAKNKKKVIFNNGIYIKLINKEVAKLLSEIKYTRNGLRLAFDRMEDDGYYQKDIEILSNKGVKIKRDTMTYVLFNFIDTPQEAYYRIKESWRCKSTPYAMKYRPLNTCRKNLHIGKYWTKSLVKAFSKYCYVYGWNRGDTLFETWIKKEKIELTKDDWDKWYYKK